MLLEFQEIKEEFIAKDKNKTLEDYEDILLEDNVKTEDKNLNEEMKIGTYALYFVANKEIERTQKAIENIEKTKDKHERNALHYQIGKVAAEYNIELQKGEACLHAYLKNYSAEDGVPKAWAHYRLAQIHMYKRNKIEALKYIDMAIAELPKIKVFKKQRDLILSI